jgi:hypothetical protein
VHSGPASYAVHRSDDGGDTWSQTAAFPNPRVALAVDTGDSDSAWTAGKWGVYRTSDEGAHWWLSIAPGGQREFLSLALSQADPSHVYAGDDHTAVVRSVDGGGSWTAIGSAGLPLGSGYGITALAVDPGSPDRLFAGTDGGGVYEIELVAPENDLPPSITGLAQVPQRLTCEPGGWRNVSDPFGFEWRRDGNLVGAGQQYTVTDPDAGAAIECVVTGSSAGGVLAVASEAVVVEPDPTPGPSGSQNPPPTSQPEPVPEVPSAPALRRPRPRSLAPPLVSGRPAAGATLRCSAGRWRSASAFAFGWTRNGRRIRGAATSRYRVRAADSGKRIGCVVTATGPGGRARAIAKPVRVRRRK